MNALQEQNDRLRNALRNALLAVDILVRELTPSVDYGRGLLICASSWQEAVDEPPAEVEVVRAKADIVIHMAGAKLDRRTIDDIMGANQVIFSLQTEDK